MNFKTEKCNFSFVINIFSAFSEQGCLPRAGEAEICDMGAISKEVSVFPCKRFA